MSAKKGSGKVGAVDGKNVQVKRAPVGNEPARGEHAPKSGQARKVEVRYEFPFTRTRVENIMKKNLPGKELSPRVKIAMNNWLGEMASSASRKMARDGGKRLALDDFENAVHKYDVVDDLRKEKERIAGRMDDLAKRVEGFAEEVDASIILKDEAPKTLIYGHLPNEYDVDKEVEQALYVEEGGVTPGGESGPGDDEGAGDGEPAAGAKGKSEE